MSTAHAAVVFSCAILSACSNAPESHRTAPTAPSKNQSSKNESSAGAAPPLSAAATTDAGTADASNTDAASTSDQDFVDVATVIPDLLLDMRYATANNFTKQKIYPRARCLLRRPVAMALAEVQQALAEDHLQLLIWDCYRPFSVQEAFWKLVPDGRYVARPVRDHGKLVKGSKHNRGAAVDLTLARDDGTPVPMPTDHDDFSQKAHRGAEGVGAVERKNSERLERAMKAGGFQSIPTEWWHFDHQRWREFSLSDEPL